MDPLPKSAPRKSASSPKPRPRVMRRADAVGAAIATLRADARLSAAN